MNIRSATRIGIILILILLWGIPCSALYDFEGIPLHVVSQGEVAGSVYTFGKYGVADPPSSLAFTLDGEVQWARTYVGVWGGTPRYTGWTELTVNNQQLPRIILYGSDDKNENVYVSGYGVYWVAYDTTTSLLRGDNFLTATTSRFESDNKLDGRIYCLVTVVVVKDTLGHTTRYWIAEGNENLHGEGWSGTNPTRHEEASITFSVRDLKGIQTANLSTLVLASTRGQPDYIQFNSRDLGMEVSGSEYPPGAKDIGDEQSFNAGFIAPLESRYVDMEVFDVRSFLREGENTVTFERGRDLDEDGEIATTGTKPEGEDYIHPALVLLLLERPQASTSAPNLVLDTIEVQDAYEGENATILLTIRNLGAFPSVPAEVRVWIDGRVIATRQVTIERSGIQEVSIPWSPGQGNFSIQGEVEIQGEADPSNNRKVREIVVGTLPDLSVSLGTPVRPGSTIPQQGDSFLQALVLGGALAVSFCLFLRRPPRAGRRISQLLLCIGILLVLLQHPISPLSPAEGGDTSSLYLLPLTVTNSGGSDASPFHLYVYLDGEQVITKEYQGGLRAGENERSELPLFAFPGSHTLRVVVDPEGHVKDADRSNNIAEITHVFS